MKKITRKIILGGAMLLLGTTAFAQFTLDGEIRPRFEHRHGFKSVADTNQKSADFIDQRTRINFGYKTEGYRFKVVFQDYRVWGSEKQLVTDDGDRTTLHEAWAEAFLNDKWTFKFGRQEIIYDDHRIFGSVAWAQQARSHDAGIFKFKSDKFKSDIGFAYNQDAPGLIGTDAFNGGYKAFQYLWLHYDFSESFGASVLALNLGKQAEDKSISFQNVVLIREMLGESRLSLLVSLLELVFQGLHFLLSLEFLLAKWLARF